MTIYRSAPIKIRAQMRRHRPVTLQVERTETIQEIVARYFVKIIGPFEIWCAHGEGTISDPYVFILKNNKIDTTKVFVEVM